MTESAYPGIHGATGSGGIKAEIAASKAQLDGVLKTLGEIEKKVASITSKARGGGFFGGGGTPGTGNNVLSQSFGATPQAPGPNTGKPGVGPWAPSFGGMGMGPMGMMGAGLGSMLRLGAMGGLGLAGMAWAALPSTEDAVATQTALHFMGTRQNNYRGLPTQQRLANNIFNGIDTYAVGGKNQPMMAAATFSGFGIQNQGMLRQLYAQNQGLSLMTGMPNSQTAAAQAGLSSGPFAARAFSYGIPVANIGTGKMADTQSIFENMWRQFMVRTDNKPTAQSVQESYLRGSLGSNFRTLGMSEDQQALALQYFTQRAKTGGPVNLSDLKGLKSMGFSEDNAAVMKEWKKDRSQAEVLKVTYQNMAKWAGKTNDALSTMYRWISDLNPVILDTAGAFKAVLETLSADPVAAPAAGAAGGLLSALLAGLGGLGGGLLGRTGGTVAKGVTSVGRAAVGTATGGLGILSAPIAALGLTSTAVGAAGLRVALSDSREDDRQWNESWLGSPMGRQSQRGTPYNPVGSRRNSHEPSLHPRLQTGGASPVPGQAQIGTGWRVKGSWGKGYHPGIDIKASVGTPVMAVMDGKVAQVSSAGDWGKHIHVKQSDGTVATYAHLSAFRVGQGDKIREGTVIGKSGATGNVTGPHLHFEVRTGISYNSRDVDPRPYVRGKNHPSAATSGAGASGSRLVEYAKKFIGVPYVAGGRSPKGWDCAGFTWYIAKHFGINIGQVSEAQLKNGSPVKGGPKNAKPGDLFVWRKKGTRGIGADGHVAMYVGGGRVIHAHGGTGGTTNITSLSAAVPSTHYLAGIRRIAGGGVGTGPALGDMGEGTDEASDGMAPTGVGNTPLSSLEVGADGRMTATSRTIADLISGANGGSPGGAPGAGTVSSTGPGNGVISVGSRSGRDRAGSGPRARGGSNQAQVWNMLMDKGFSKHAAAGIIGNLMQESGVNPNSNQHGGGPGRGIMQWTVNERWASLQSWAKKSDRNPRSLGTQVDFMVKEMRDYGVLGKMRGMDNYRDATVFFQEKMERAGIPAYANRYRFAKEALQHFGRGGYSRGAYNMRADEDARVHAGEMIVPADKAQEVRHAMAGVMAGGKAGGHTFNITCPPGNTEEQARFIVNKVLAALDRRSSTQRLMET